ncbi:hypothetical protein L9F63_010456, partial [Diploptera punctata]
KSAKLDFTVAFLFVNILFKLSKSLNSSAFISITVNGFFVQLFLIGVFREILPLCRGQKTRVNQERIDRNNMGHMQRHLPLLNYFQSLLYFHSCICKFFPKFYCRFFGFSIFNISESSIFSFLFVFIKLPKLTFCNYCTLVYKRLYFPIRGNQKFLNIVINNDSLVYCVRRLFLLNPLVLISFIMFMTHNTILISVFFFLSIHIFWCPMLFLLGRWLSYYLTTLTSNAEKLQTKRMVMYNQNPMSTTIFCHWLYHLPTKKLLRSIFSSHCGLVSGLPSICGLYQLQSSMEKIFSVGIALIVPIFTTLKLCTASFVFLILTYSVELNCSFPFHSSHLFVLHCDFETITVSSSVQSWRLMLCRSEEILLLPSVGGPMNLWISCFTIGNLCLRPCLVSSFLLLLLYTLGIWTSNSLLMFGFEDLIHCNRWPNCVLFGGLPFFPKPTSIFAAQFQNFVFLYTGTAVFKRTSLPFSTDIMITGFFCSFVSIAGCQY